MKYFIYAINGPSKFSRNLGTTVTFLQKKDEAAMGLLSLYRCCLQKQFYFKLTWGSANLLGGPRILECPLQGSQASKLVKIVEKKSLPVLWWKPEVAI